jgi:hypothetical protein
MLANLETKNRLELHLGRVTKVYDSGLLDIKGIEPGRKFQRINIVSGGVPNSFDVGDLCVVMSDGSQKYVIGQVREPQKDRNGNISIRDLNDDLASMPGAKGLVTNDDFGNQARVVVMRGGGVVIDSGELAGMHFNPGTGEILSFSERAETNMPGFSKFQTHDGETTVTTYIWRTKVDHAAVERDLLNETDHAQDQGHTLRLDITDAGVMTFYHYIDGVETWNFNVDGDGQWSLKHGQAIEHEGGDWPAMAKKTHQMIMAAVDTILDFQWIDSMGTPHQLRTDPLFGASNVSSRDTLSDTTYGTEDATLIAFKKMLLEQLT